MPSTHSISPRVAATAAILLSLCVAPALLGAPQDAEKVRNFPIQPKQIDLPQPENDPRAVAIVDRYIEAIGGRDVLDAIRDKSVTFETVKHAMAGETKAELKLYLKRDYKIREEWNLPGFKIADQELQFVQVYDGYDGWVQMFGTVSPLEGRTLSIFVWDKPIDDFFLHWQEDGYTLRHIGDGDIDGEAVDLVQATDFHGVSISTYAFSKATGLLLEKKWTDQDQSGQVTKTNRYLLYRDIPFKNDPSKKIKVALHQKIFTGEDLDSERKYTAIAFNTGLSDAIFEKPAGVDFTGGVGGGRGSGGNVAMRRAFEQFQRNRGARGGAPAPSSADVVPPAPPEGSRPKTTGPRPVVVPDASKNPHDKK